MSLEFRFIVEGFVAAFFWTCVHLFSVSFHVFFKLVSVKKHLVASFLVAVYTQFFYLGLHKYWLSFHRLYLRPVPNYRLESDVLYLWSILWSKCPGLGLVRFRFWPSAFATPSPLVRRASSAPFLLYWRLSLFLKSPTRSLCLARNRQNRCCNFPPPKTPDVVPKKNSLV